MNELKSEIATVLCPRFPLAIEGLDFGDGADRPLPGGFCVFAVDLPDSLDRIAALRAGRGTRTPYLCSDLERGAGQQIAGLTRLPPAMALGAAADPDLAFAAGRLTALEAKAAGIAVVFAPVVDVADEPRNPIVATRAYSAFPHEVATLAAAFIRGVESEGIVATPKHFPGHGRTTEDSHLSLPLLSRSRAEFAASEEIPFRAAFEAGARAIMIGHLHATGLDPKDGPNAVPTSLSWNTITGYLRGDLGFRGVVFTDALDMGAIPQGDANDFATDPSVRALLAGVDVPLLPKDPHRSARAIRDAVNSGLLPRERLREAARRVRALVDGFAPPATPSRIPQSSGKDLALTIARRAITALPTNAHAMRFAGHDVDVICVDDGRGVTRFPVFLDALEAAEIRPHVIAGDHRSGRRPLLVAVFSDVRCNKGRVVLSEADTRRVAALSAGEGDVVELSIGCPQALFDVPLVRPRLYTYDDDDASLTALAEALAGAFTPSGHPVFSSRSDR